MIEYRVIIIVDGAPGLNQPPVAGTEILIGQLTPGRTYTVILFARNIVGYGESETWPFTTTFKGNVISKTTWLSVRWHHLHISEGVTSKVWPLSTIKHIYRFKCDKLKCSNRYPK